MIAHDDDGGRVPRVVLLKKLADVIEITVGKSEVVYVGRVGSGKGGGLAVIDAAWVWNRQMEKDEVDRGVGEQSVRGSEDIAVVLNVQVSIS